MNQNIISFKMFIRNIFSDGMLSAIIFIPLLLAAIYGLFSLNCTALSDAKKDFSLYYPILDLFPCNYVSLHDLLRFGLGGIG